MLQWFDILADLLRNLHMVLEDVLERIYRQFQPQSDVEILAETKATQVIGMHNIADVVIIFDESHNG